MRFRFNRDVRLTLAEELRKVSTFGGIALGLFGYSARSPILVLGAFIWWVACQTISALLLAMEDEE